MIKSMISVVDGVPASVGVYTASGEMFIATPSSHPAAFKQIVDRLQANPQDEGVVELFDLSKPVAAKFEKISDRVTVSGGRVFFDLDPVDEVISQQIVRYMEAGISNWQSLVNFLERLYQNPSANSRTELYAWLENGNFTITDDGRFVGYKGVQTRNGVPSSTRPAPASEMVTVNGEQVVGYVPNNDGAVISMPRSKVDEDLNRHCSNGLHVGTFSYAKGFTGSVLEVLVCPSRVVSVTADEGRAKIRVSEYEVVKAILSPYETPLRDWSETDEDDWDDEYEDDDCECCNYDDYDDLDEDEVDEEEDPSDEGFYDAYGVFRNV